MKDLASTSSATTWATRDPETGRHHRNAHLLELGDCDWICLVCRHHFDAAVDADLFVCGEQCVHPRPIEDPA